MFHYESGLKSFRDRRLGVALFVIVIVIPKTFRIDALRSKNRTFFVSSRIFITQFSICQTILL